MNKVTDFQIINLFGFHFDSVLKIKYAIIHAARTGIDATLKHLLHAHSLNSNFKNAVVAKNTPAETTATNVKKSWISSGFILIGHTPRPLSCGKCSPVNRQPLGCPLIVALFSPCRPSTICWLVITIHVYSLNRKIWARLPAHILKKIFKRSLPMGANSYPAPAVVFEVFAFWPSAPIKHSDPCDILWNSGAVRAVTVLSIQHCRSLSVEASA
jgi:hypothetical protein